MYNSIRNYQFLGNFLDLINLYYKYEFTSILVTYYLFDSVNSIYDKEVLRFGAYERVGNYSGYKWIKINYFPVAYSQQTNPRFQQNNYGVNTATETQCVFPKINFEPTALDLISFYVNGSETTDVYQVSSFEQSYIGNKAPIYKVILKEQYFDLNNVEQQVERIYAYSEISDKIYEPLDYNLIVQATTKLHTVTTELQTKVIQNSKFISI